VSGWLAEQEQQDAVPNGQRSKVPPMPASIDLEMI